MGMTDLDLGTATMARISTWRKSQHEIGLVQHGMNLLLAPCLLLQGCRAAHVSSEQSSHMRPGLRLPYEAETHNGATHAHPCRADRRRLFQQHY